MGAGVVVFVCVVKTGVEVEADTVSAGEAESSTAAGNADG